MKLQLVSIHIKDSPLAMPLAAAMLKASLDDNNDIANNLDTSLLDFHLGDIARGIANNIITTNSDYVGFSVYLWNRDLILEVAKILQQETKLTLFAGGAEPTANPNSILASGFFDFIIKGESEIVIQQVMQNLMAKKSLNEVSSVYLKENKTKIKQARIVMQLDDFVSPFLSGAIDVKNYKGVLWELSRGCIFKCSFCFEGRGIEGVRRFSLQRLRKELELFEGKQVTQIWVLDPTFNQQRTRAKELLRMIYDVAPQIHFTFEVRTEFLDEEMAHLFAQLHCSLQIGLQSANIPILTNILRKFDPQKYAQKISLLNQAGATFGLDLIYGLPGDNLAGFKKSLDYAVSLQPNNLDIFPLAILPGTQLKEDASKFQLNYRKNSPYTIFDSPTYSKKEMEASAKITDAFNLFYNQGGAVSWLFMILETLKMKPSAFFDDFVSYLNEQSTFINKNHHSQQEILQLQLGFIERLFVRRKLSQLYNVMSDIVTYHNYIIRSLFIGAKPIITSIEDVSYHQTKLNLAPATFLVKLNYCFDDLRFVGEYNLHDFVKSFKVNQANVLIYNDHGNVKIEDLEIPAYGILSQIKESIVHSEISTKLNQNDLRSFIQHAMINGVIEYQ